jgi:transposase, IS30 family
LQRHGLLNDQSVVPESEVGQVPGARLTIDEREEIALGVATGRSFADIAVQLDRPTSTVSREVERNGGRVRYRASRAQRDTDRRASRPRVRRLVADRRLAREVAKRLKKKHSPEQIANRLRLEHPDEPHWWVSHETIYQALYLQGRGGLRGELTEALRTGRARRRRKGPNPGRGARGKLKDVVLISERPAEAEDRAVPGHWEGDLILGRAGKSQIATMVERTTRFTLLVRLPENRKAITVRDAVAAKIVELPEQLRRSLTWDQGKEMAAHVSFSVATDVAVYFCDPHSPWQRGTNENTNGLLRQYLPRSLDFSTVTDVQLNAIAAELNERPRQTLGWMTPSEKFSELVAMAA